MMNRPQLAELKPDPINDEKTFPEYVKKLPKFNFVAGVPKEVRTMFVVVDKLLQHSYFEYQFIDIAFLRALQIFELACKTRLKQLNSKTPSSLQKCINQLIEKNEFESEKAFVLHLNSIRNYLSHPERHSYAGIIYLKKFDLTTILINELFCDKMMQKDRMSLERKFSQQAQTIGLNSGQLIKRFSESLVSFRIELIGVDNTTERLQHHVAFVPMVPIYEMSDHQILPVLHYFVLTDLKWTKTNLMAFDNGIHENIVVSSIREEKTQTKLRKWLNKFNENRIMLEGGIEIDLFRMRMKFMTDLQLKGVDT
jgi:molybdopterin-biosynthesis enzyme MoeA-like protein